MSLIEARGERVISPYFVNLQLRCKMISLTEKNFKTKMERSNTNGT